MAHIVKARSALPYVEVFGLRTYDEVEWDGGKTCAISYLTAPNMWSYTIEYTVRTWPTFHLIGAKVGDPKHKPVAYLNYIRRDPDGRWFTDQNMEITLVSRPEVIGKELEQWDSTIGPPWVFHADVDYTLSVYHCRRTERDFNAERATPQPLCPFCKDARYCWPERVTIMPPRDRAWSQASSYQIQLGADQLLQTEPTGVPLLEIPRSPEIVQGGWPALARRIHRRFSS